MQQRLVALIAGVGVARDVRRPLVFGGVRVARADVFVLQRFELLLRAEFVGLVGGLVWVVGGGWGRGYHGSGVVFSEGWDWM